MMDTSEISDLEQEIAELTQKLNRLRKALPPREVGNYSFSTLNGSETLLDLFGDKDRLLMIHNMGQGCRYCTLWADGFNGFLPHLESALSVALVSKDPPETQQRFASSRGWRFHLASHGGGEYIQEQSVIAGSANMPGAVVYQRSGDAIVRGSSCAFGPGDLYCSMWGLLALAGLGEEEWTPQYNYWRRPEKLDDGGANIID
jgi:predicted dithiol-disulfide oxidoreductase (DUF899 family)